MRERTRAEALDAVDLLNDLIGEIVTGTMCLARHEAEWRRGEIEDDVRIGVRRMCVGHLILALSRWSEFYEKLGHMIPRSHGANAKSIAKSIKCKEIRTFRNTCVGHIWNNKLDRPMRASEIGPLLEKITAPSVPQFLEWLNRVDSATTETSVRRVSEEIRDSLMEEYSILPKEVVDR